MSRILSLIMIGLGGYFLFQKRYRLLNVILGNSYIRRLLVNSFMNIPGIRNRMMKTVFSNSNTL